MAELLKQQDCWKIFEDLKRSHDVQRQHGGTTPYSLMIEMMLEDENGDFCLAIAEMALAKTRTKGLFIDKGSGQASRKVWWTEGVNNA
jgi:hypothetical protein